MVEKCGNYAPRGHNIVTLMYIYYGNKQEQWELCSFQHDYGHPHSYIFWEEAGTVEIMLLLQKYGHDHVLGWK